MTLGLFQFRQISTCPNRPIVYFASFVFAFACGNSGDKRVRHDGSQACHRGLLSYCRKLCLPRGLKKAAYAAAAFNGGVIGGTAWLFARPEMANQLDYLFVDEAGQVSIANLAGMCHATKNIVLIGDQMQLGQPIQGSQCRLYMSSAAAVCFSRPGRGRRSCAIITSTSMLTTPDG